MAKRDNKIRADFYQVVNLKGSLSAILDGLLETETDKRNVDANGQPLRLERLEKKTDANGTFYEGEFVKVRMDNLPVKASTTSGIGSIGLRDDEGIGEETAFLYSQDRDILILQRNRFGATFLRVEEYFNTFGGADNHIGLSVMMNANALKRLKSAKAVKSVSVCVAPVGGAQIDSLRGVSVGKAIGAMEELGGEKVTLTVSLAARGSGSLIMDKIMDIARSVIDVRNQSAISVPKMQVKAEDDDGTSIIDFVKDRLSCCENIPNDNDRHLSYNARISFLRSAWNSKGFQNVLMLQ